MFLYHYKTTLHLMGASSTTPLKT